MKQRQFIIFLFIIITALGLVLMARRSEGDLLTKMPGQEKAFLRKFHAKKH